MDDDSKEHIQQVRQWLEENVQLYFTPKKVTLHSFEVDWDELSGSFRVLLDDNDLPHRFSFEIDTSGKAEFFLPMFHSPLGAPASYGAINLSESTSKAILEGLREAIPKVRGCGRNRETGLEITNCTPINDRVIDHEEFDLAKKRVESPNYIITVKT